MNPFQDPTIRNSFFSLKDTRWVSKQMGILACDGEGPFDEQDFYDFLLDQGCAAVPLESAIALFNQSIHWQDLVAICCTTIYAHRVDEFRANLEEVCQHNSDIVAVFGEDFRYADWAKFHQIESYSQEMILMWLSTALNPYHGDPRALEILLMHPALALELDSEAWPSVEAEPDNSNHSLTIDAPEKGLLSYFGYQVGQKAPPPKQRREALAKAFREAIPLDSFPHHYALSCGLPGSPERLHKIATTIAALIRNGKRRGQPLATAVEHWEADLEWLKDTYYLGFMRKRFPWEDWSRND